MSTTTTHLTPAELAARWGGVVSVGTLANWRAAKPQRGPAFLKIGTKVAYPLDHVEAYERANSRGVAANDNTNTEQAA